MRRILGLGWALILACRPGPLPSDAESADGPGLRWRSPSGLETLQWTATRWARDGGRLRAEVQVEASGSLPPLRWALDDVVGRIGAGELELSDRAGVGVGQLTVALPRPPPRVAALRLEVGGPGARWTPVLGPGSDGFVLTFEDGAPRVPHVSVPVRTSSITVDGRLDEPAWAAAPELDFAPSMGDGAAVPEDRRTTLRLLWDDDALYVGFEARDPDVTEKARDRDDPVYDHEAVELFLMPHAAGPGTGPYVELQASPTGVIFDASFVGPRKGMDAGWNGGQIVVSEVDGSLGAPEPDRAWTSEWRVPFDSLRWVRNNPRPGDVWRMNAFRIDRSRGLPDLYVAWSPPRVGDFHKVERFGFMTFEAAPTTRNPP
jgi:hypothetical protein